MLRTAIALDPPPEWTALCEADPHATLFNHPRWMEAVVRAYPEYEPRYLTAALEDRTVGVVPLVRRRRMGLVQYLSMPFGTHGGPVVEPGQQAAAAAALAHRFLRTVKGPRTLRFEMSVFDPPVPLREGLTPVLGAYFQEFRTHLIDLTEGFDALWSGCYDRNTRNCVRMSERAGVTAGEERGPEALATLHRLHDAQARAWEGIQAHSASALQAVIESLGEDARIHIARRGDEPLMATLFLEHAGREIHPWVSGSSPEARPVRAAHLLYNNALRDACARGLEVWNFGGSGGNEKIEFFKTSLGGRPVPVLRCFHLAGWARRLRRGPAWD